MPHSHASQGRARIFSLLFVLAVIALAIWVPWRVNHRDAFVDLEPPEEQPQGEVQFAGTQPKNAFRLEDGKVLARTVFSALGPADSRVEIRDLEFPPHARTRLGALSGPGVLEVYSGQGSVSWDGQTGPLAGGLVRGVPAGRALEFDNQGEHSLVVRIYAVGGR